MRINLGRDTRHFGARSYLDAADDIVGLPMHEFVRTRRTTERGGWLEDCAPERVPDFLNRLYGLATQI